MNPKLRQAWRVRLDAKRTSMGELFDFCKQEGEIGDLARQEMVDRIVMICVEAALQYDEPGWHVTSPVYAAMEYQGVTPQMNGSSASDQVMNAAIRMRFTSKTQKWAVGLLNQLSPRKRVALLVDGLRQQEQLTRREACQPDIWQQLVHRLQLSRWYEPSKLKGMTVKRHEECCRLGRVFVRESVG